jgi:large subunit ribosomal protein L10
MKPVLVAKQQAVKDLRDVAMKSHSVVAVHYRGMNVSSMTALRSAARKQNVYLKVIRNTLARRALAESQYAGVVDKITGPVVLAFSMEEPNAAARLFKSFVKDYGVLAVQVIGVENAVYAASELGKIADMPSKDQAIAILLGSLQSPIRTLACTLQETYATLVRVVDQVAKKRESQQ